MINTVSLQLLLMSHTGLSNGDVWWSFTIIQESPSFGSLSWPGFPQDRQICSLLCESSVPLYMPSLWVSFTTSVWAFKVSHVICGLYPQHLAQCLGHSEYSIRYDERLTGWLLVRLLIVLPFRAFQMSQTLVGWEKCSKVYFFYVRMHREFLLL